MCVKSRAFEERTGIAFFGIASKLVITALVKGSFEREERKLKGATVCFEVKNPAPPPHGWEAFGFALACVTSLLYLLRVVLMYCEV